MNKVKDFWGRGFRHLEQQVQRWVLGGFLVQLRNNRKEIWLARWVCQLMRLGRRPRTRPRRTWLAVDSIFCVNGRCWKVLSKGMIHYFHSSPAAVWRMECRRARVGVERPAGNYCTFYVVTWDWRGTKNRKGVCIVPLWCSIWSKTCVLLAIQIKLLHVSPLCFTSNCKEPF